MPTYEYHCEKCDKAFDEFQSIKSDPVANCPECGAECKRQFSAGGGIIFKGSGFYVNDYKNKGCGSGSSSSSAPTACDSCPKNS